MNITIKTVELNQDIKITLTAKRGYEVVNKGCINEKEGWIDANEIVVNVKGVNHTMTYTKLSHVAETHNLSWLEKDNEMVAKGCVAKLQDNNSFVIGLAENSNAKVEAILNEANAEVDTPEVIAKRNEIEAFKAKNLKDGYEHDQAMKRAEWMATLGGKSY